MKEIAKINIERAALLAMREFQHTDGFRAILLGTNITITDKHAELVATDGRRLAVMQLPHIKASRSTADGAALPISFTVNLPLLAKVPALKDGSVVLRVFANEEVIMDGNGVPAAARWEGVHHITIEGRGDMQISATPIYGEFPKWRQVIPTSEFSPFYEFSFNPELMDGFRRAAKLLCGSSPSVIIRSHRAKSDTEYSPYSIFIGRGDFYGCIMPMRNFNPLSMPEWLVPKAQPEQPTNVSVNETQAVPA